MKGKIEILESLDDFIERHERQAHKAHLVVTSITFPRAESRVFPGKYAGIPVADGKPAAIYSDGSKHI